MKLLPGLRVIDITAIKNNWPDKFGMIMKVDGSNVKVCYDSDTERWKAVWNLQISDDNPPDLFIKASK